MTTVDTDETAAGEYEHTYACTDTAADTAARVSAARVEACRPASDSHPSTRPLPAGAAIGASLRSVLPADRSVSRLAQLAAGLVLYGVSESMMLAPALGVDPWDVLHTGLARITGIPVGTVLILVGALVLLLWIPLRQRPGLGTLANIVVIGAVVDVVLAAAPAPHALWLRIALFATGVFLNAVATGFYIGAGLGAGPRDGLTTGLAARGHSIRVVRTAIELTVLAAGWLLGGNIGFGTLGYALAIGPLTHIMIPLFARDRAGTAAAG
jgi:uncharacterized membrane protein YczE